MRSQAVSRPYLSPMIAAPSPICITVFHSKLCWTTKKLSLCILYLLCSNVCRLFSMWARPYQGLYAHFINRQKSSHPAASVQPVTAAWCPFFITFMYVCVCVINLAFNCFIMVQCFFLHVVPSLRDRNMLLILHYQQQTHNHKGRGTKI